MAPSENLVFSLLSASETPKCVERDKCKFGLPLLLETGPFKSPKNFSYTAELKEEKESVQCWWLLMS